MPRPVASSPTIVASVRAWFGLNLAELALYLGVNKSLVHAIEEGRRRLSATTSTALLPLALLLPAPGTPAAAAPSLAALPPGTPAPEAAALGLRRRVCQQQAARLLAQADALARRAHLASRWAAALLPPDPDAPGPPAAPASPALAAALAAALALAADPLDPTRAATRARWLRGWLRQRAQPLPAPEATHYHLLRARAAGLLAEAAALAEATGPPQATT